MQDDVIVRVATATNATEAHLWRQALEDEGISAKVVGDLLDAGFGEMPGTQAEVWVHRDDVERASAFLEAHRHAAGATEPDEA